MFKRKHRFYRILIMAVLSTVSFISCGKDGGSIVNSNEITEPDFSARVGGALTTTFDGDKKDFQHIVSIRITPDSKLLNMSFYLTVDKPVNAEMAEREQARIDVIFPFESSNNVPESGNYIVEKNAEAQFNSRFSYDRKIDSFNFDRLIFDGERLAMVIEKVTAERISGRLSLDLLQVSGQRSINGLIEDLHLAFNGRANAFVEFDVPYTVQTQPE